jgi:hypothetical protein
MADETEKVFRLHPALTSQVERGERSQFYDEKNELWFLHPDYHPCPEYDIEIGALCFCYRPEYIEYFEKRGKSGHSLLSTAAKMNIPFSIIKQWARGIKEFAIGLEMAHEKAQEYFEEIGRTAILAKEFNANGFLKMMAVKFPDHWREIEPSATVTKENDPYGFDQQIEEADAAQAAEEVIERVLRLKHDAEEKESTG